MPVWFVICGTAGLKIGGGRNADGEGEEAAAVACDGGRK